MYIQRHGESESNALRVYSCFKLDPSLTEAGKKQIESHLKFYEDKSIKQIITSPSQRAIETGKIIASHLSLSIKIDELLYEVNMGELEGKSMDDEENIKIFTSTIDNWMKGDKTMKFAGGESYKDIKLRLDHIEKYYMHDTNTLLVAHATLFALLIGRKNTYKHSIFELFLPRGGRGYYNGNEWIMIDKREINQS